MTGARIFFDTQTAWALPFFWRARRVSFMIAITAIPDSSVRAPTDATGKGRGPTAYLINGARLLLLRCSSGPLQQRDEKLAITSAAAATGTQ